MSQEQTQDQAQSTLVALTKAIFHFKTEKMKDATGNVIGEGKKHPSVEIDLPVPTAARLIQFLSDPVTFAKEVELLTGAVTDQIYRVARGQINDFRDANKDGTVTAASINYSKLDWTAIANMPKSERTSSVPSDEDIKAFLASYLEIMPTALNKSKDKIENHVLCFSAGFKKQRAQKDILEMFNNALNIYLTAAGNETVEEHIEVIEYFSGRLNKMLSAEEKLSLDNL